MNAAIGEPRFPTTEDAASGMLRASVLKSHSSQPPNRSSHPSRNNHPTPTVHAPPSRGEALRPRGFYHRLRDEKSLVYFMRLTPCFFALENEIMEHDYFILFD